MYLIKSFTLENSNHTITFDLFDKDCAPILIESALDSNGSRVVRAYDDKEDIMKRLWVLAGMSNGASKVHRAIQVLRIFVKEFYGSK